jgi:hypothetical protein
MLQKSPTDEAYWDAVRVEAYFQRLATDIGIGGEQAEPWTGVARIAAANAERMGAQCRECPLASYTAQPDMMGVLGHRIVFLCAQAAALSSLRLAVRPLYDVLTPRQRVKTDKFLGPCFLAGQRCLTCMTAGQ